MGKDGCMGLRMEQDSELLSPSSLSLDRMTSRNPLQLVLFHSSVFTDCFACMLVSIRCLETEDEVYFPRTSPEKCDIINKLYMAPHVIEEIEIAPGKRYKTSLIISAHNCMRIFRVLLRH